jgi:hypothetical protein
MGFVESHVILLPELKMRARQRESQQWRQQSSTHDGGIFFLKKRVAAPTTV